MKIIVDGELIDPKTKNNPDNGEIIPRKAPQPLEPGKKIPLND